MMRVLLNVVKLAKAVAHVAGHQRVTSSGTVITVAPHMRQVAPAFGVGDHVDSPEGVREVVTAAWTSAESGRHFYELQGPHGTRRQVNSNSMAHWKKVPAGAPPAFSVGDHVDSPEGVRHVVTAAWTSPESGRQFHELQGPRGVSRQEHSMAGWKKVGGR